MVTTVNEVKSYKTKVPDDDLFFMVFCSFVLLPNLIGNQCKFASKQRLHTSMQTNNCVCVYVLVHYFVVPDIHF